MSTNIEWCDETWNPVTGCTPISEGCQNCYAARMAQRLAGRYGYPEDDPFRPGTFHDDKLDWPLSLPKGKRKRIFVSSMGDLFHDSVTHEHIVRVVDTISLCKDHTFIMLTKRPGNALKFCKSLSIYFPENIWFGVTAENQHFADKRIPILLQIPAAVRFVSIEPMLGPVDITRYLQGRDNKNFWVIAGGETGPNARPMQTSWARSLRDQCLMTRTPFFFKKHGSYWYGRNDKSGNHKLDGHTWEQFPEG